MQERHLHQSAWVYYWVGQHIPWLEIHCLMTFYERNALLKICAPQLSLFPLSLDESLNDESLPS